MDILGVRPFEDLRTDELRTSEIIVFVGSADSRQPTADFRLPTVDCRHAILERAALAATPRRGAAPIGGIEQHLLDFITSVYNAIRWPGVVILMAIESAAIPIPSELIMPLAGWKLVKEKGLGVEWLVIAGLFGALGNTLGSIVAYYAGAWGGRPLVLKYGKYVLISHHDLDLADRFFQRWGAWAIFFARLLPVVRTFVSVPAGIARMPIGRFASFTFAGSFPWSLGLAAAGYILGENYEKIRTWTRPADVPIAIVIAGLVAWYVIRHVRRAWEAPEPSGPEVR